MPLPFYSCKQKPTVIPEPAYKIRKSSHKCVDKDTKKAFQESVYNEWILKDMRRTLIFTGVVVFVVLQFFTIARVDDGSSHRHAIWWFFKAVPPAMKFALAASLTRENGQVDMSPFAWRQCVAVLSLHLVQVGIAWANMHILLDTLQSFDNPSKAFVGQTQAHYVASTVFWLFATNWAGTAGHYISLPLQIVMTFCSLLGATVWCIVQQQILTNDGYHGTDVTFSMEHLMIMAVVSGMLLVQNYHTDRRSLEQFQRNKALSLEVAKQDLLAATSATSLAEQVKGGAVRRMVASVFAEDEGHVDAARKQINIFKRMSSRYVPLTAGSWKKNKKEKKAGKGEIHNPTGIFPQLESIDYSGSTTGGGADRKWSVEPSAKDLRYLAAARRGLEVAMNWAVRVEGRPAWKQGQKVFLGGSCNPTMWRKDVAIPAFEKFGVPFYNPQVENWSPGPPYSPPLATGLRHLPSLAIDAGQATDFLSTILHHQPHTHTCTFTRTYITHAHSTPNPLTHIF
jgi:hypothetical protein